jgi:hypothetical protein
VLSLIYDASLMSCIDEDGSMCCHMMHSWIDVNMMHYFLIMFDKEYKWMKSKVVPLW